MNGEAPTFGLRRGTVLCVAGGGYRAAMFHLGALTRLNELGLLAGTETICAVSGGSILASLVATRVPWPLYGAYREWPERVAEPLHEICSRSARRSRLRPAAGAGAAHAERYARELAGWQEGEAPGWPRIVFGAAGLELGQMAGRQSDEGESSLYWELNRPRGATRDDTVAAVAAGIPVGLSPLAEGERALLENHGYCLADAALRQAGEPGAPIEPLPPLPPHPQWHVERRARSLARRPRRRLVRSGRGRRRTDETRGAPGDAVELLQRHRPFVQYDSLESYRPESVVTIAELAVGSRCNTLHRANGELLASVLPLEGAARLDLDYLDAPAYADGRQARIDDYLDEAGGSHAGDAFAARDSAGCDEVVYGRAARGGGRLWLQYWFFYYYNDKGFLKAGRHEGDWEVVQLRVGGDGTPDAIVYGRHHSGERDAWGEAERQRDEEGGEGPVVYCARGSHGALPQAGTQPAPIVPDHNDGLGPRTRPRLIEIGEQPPGWVRWPGRWGSTRRREAFEGDSPRGPAHQPQWHDPAGFYEDARPVAERPRWEEEPPPTPRFAARREGNHVVLVYSFGERFGRSGQSRIVAAIVGDDRDASGIVHSFGVDGRTGACALPVPGGAALTAVRACVISGLGGPGPTLTVPVA